MLELSYGTRLPVLSTTDEAVEVARPEGGSAYLRRTAVALHAPGTPWPALSGARLEAEARRFLGLQYLWAGTSGFGLDCSGFTHLVCKALGVTIPRDADDQATHGTKVATRGALRAGDLVFFRNASGIHHVGLFVGDGKMIHAPGHRPRRDDRLAGRRALPQRVRRRPAAHALGGRRWTQRHSARGPAATW